MGRGFCLAAIFTPNSYGRDSRRSKEKAGSAKTTKCVKRYTPRSCCYPRLRRVFRASSDVEMRTPLVDEGRVASKKDSLLRISNEPRTHVDCSASQDTSCGRHRWHRFLPTVHHPPPVKQKRYSSLWPRTGHRGIEVIKSTLANHLSQSELNAVRWYRPPVVRCGAPRPPG